MAVLRRLASGRQLLTGAVCAFLLVFPYRAFDHYGTLTMLGGELGVLILGLLFLRPYRQYVVLTFISLLVFLAAGEAGFRLVHFGVNGLSPACRPADASHPLALFERDAQSYTGLKPNTKAIFKGLPLTINDAGFRGASYPRQKPENTCRIVMLGASACMGTGVRDHEVHSAILEQRLNDASAGRRFEVINLSLAANQAGAMLDILRKIGLSYEPDLILFLANRTLMPVGPLRIEPPRVKIFTGPRRQLFTDPAFDFFSSAFFFPRLIKQSRRGRLQVPSLFGRQGLSRPAGGARLATDEDDPMEEGQTPGGLAVAVDETLDALRAAAGDIPMALYLLKPIAALHDPDHQAGYRAMLKEKAAARGMRVIDTFEACWTPYSERDLLLYPGDNHPNSVAHRVYADKVFEDLKPIVRDL